MERHPPPFSPYHWSVLCILSCAVVSNVHSISIFLSKSDPFWARPTNGMSGSIFVLVALLVISSHLVNWHFFSLTFFGCCLTILRHDLTILSMSMMALHILLMDFTLQGFSRHCFSQVTFPTSFVGVVKGRRVMLPNIWWCNHIFFSYCDTMTCLSADIVDQSYLTYPS